MSFKFHLSLGLVFYYMDQSKWSDKTGSVQLRSYDPCSKRLTYTIKSGGSLKNWLPKVRWWKVAKKKTFYRTIDNLYYPQCK